MLTAGVAMALVLLSAAPASAAVDCNKYPCDPACKGFCGAGCVETCFVDGDAVNPGNGTPTTWAASPIKYKVNVTDLITAQGLNKTEVLAAIQAAFTAWEQIPCAKIKFEFAGETTATTQQVGFILIYFKNDPADSTLYFMDLGMKQTNMDEMEYSLLQLNCRPTHPQFSFKWTTKGAEADKFDIQTVLTFFMPSLLGFQVGQNTGAQSYTVPYAYNYKLYELCAEHKTMAAYSYFDTAGSGCTKLTPPPAVCTTGGTPGDGVTKDSGPPTEGGVNPGNEGGVNPNTEGGVVGEGTLPPAEDEGCCRVGHARSASVPYLSLLGFALLLFLGWRRRK